MVRVVSILVAILLWVGCQAQLSTVFINVVGEQWIDQPLTAHVWKQMPDSTFKVRSKTFTRQAMISLDPGLYVLQVKFEHSSLYVDSFEFSDESCIVYNVLVPPIPLSQVDFESIIYVSPGMLDLISRRLSYMQF